MPCSSITRYIAIGNLRLHLIEITKITLHRYPAWVCRRWFIKPSVLSNSTSDSHSTAKNQTRKRNGKQHSTMASMQCAQCMTWQVKGLKCKSYTWKDILNGVWMPKRCHSTNSIIKINGVICYPITNMVQSCLNMHGLDIIE